MTSLKGLLSLLAASIRSITMVRSGLQGQHTKDTSSFVVIGSMADRGLHLHD